MFTLELHNTTPVFLSKDETEVISRLIDAYYNDYTIQHVDNQNLGWRGPAELYSGPYHRMAWDKLERLELINAGPDMTYRISQQLREWIKSADHKLNGDQINGRLCMAVRLGLLKVDQIPVLTEGALNFLLKAHQVKADYTAPVVEEDDDDDDDYDYDYNDWNLTPSEPKREDIDLKNYWNKLEHAVVTDLLCSHDANLKTLENYGLIDIQDSTTAMITRIGEEYLKMKEALPDG